MTALTEAVVLPLTFLTVVLIGAVRPGAAVTVVPPQPAALVTALMLLVLLVRSGALAPDRLMNSSRPALANINGLIVLLTLFAASAQVVTLLVPSTGVPALIGWTVLISLLVQAFAIGPDRTRVLRGLAVTLGAAFLLKFVVLAALSAPAQGRLSRALQLLFEGVTLGTMTQPPPHPGQAYLAFGTVILFLVGVALLPSAPWQMVRVSASRTLVATRDGETDLTA